MEFLPILININVSFIAINIKYDLEPVLYHCICMLDELEGFHFSLAHPFHE